MIELGTVWILKELETCIMEHIAGKTSRRGLLKERGLKNVCRWENWWDKS